MLKLRVGQHNNSGASVKIPNHSMALLERKRRVR